MRFIVVDDEEDVRLVLRLYLESRGHEVVDGTDGAAARRLCAEEPADVLLLDVSLPHEDGLQVLAALRAAGTAPPEVYVMSALPPSHLRELAHASTATPLPKPFTVEGLDEVFGRTARG